MVYFPLLSLPPAVLFWLMMNQICRCKKNGGEKIICAESIVFFPSKKSKRNLSQPQAHSLECLKSGLDVVPLSLMMMS